MDKDYKIYLKHIFDSIILIEKYTENILFEEFEKDRKTIDAVIRNFEIIGEASKNISDEIKKNYPHIPWKSMKGLGNILIHEYFGVDISAVWENIKHELPNLKKQIKSILEDNKKMKSKKTNKKIFL